MTKEQLDRIKKAYSSGLKVQIWFNGYWEDFDIRDYSMCSDPFSENRQYRIVGSDYADIAEKSITKLENKVEVMGRQIDELKGIIALKNQNAAEYKKTSIYRGWSTLCYKDKYDTCLRENTGLKIHNAYVEKKLDGAKEIIAELVGVISFPNIYENLINKANNFLKEVKN